MELKDGELDFDIYEGAIEHIGTEDFMEDALKVVGLWGHPKAVESYSMAWKRGHEGGLREVFFHLDDIANMIFDGKIDA